MSARDDGPLLPLTYTDENGDVRPRLRARPGGKVGAAPPPADGRPLSVDDARNVLHAYRDSRPLVDTAILVLNRAGVGPVEIAREAGMVYTGVRKALIRLGVR